MENRERNARSSRSGPVRSGDKGVVTYAWIVAPWQFRSLEDGHTTQRRPGGQPPWKPRSRCRGTADHDAVESAIAMVRNTHPASDKCVVRCATTATSVSDRKGRRARTGMPDPTTAEDWVAVATERLADAKTLARERSGSIAGVYMAGYAVECCLKAFLQQRSIPRPGGGPAGHDLRALWASSGLQVGDLRDRDGLRSFFLVHWSTALRYEVTPPRLQSQHALVNGAGELVGWLLTLIRRRARKRK
jgi:hypothetical protein